MTSWTQSGAPKSRYTRNVKFGRSKHSGPCGQDAVNNGVEAQMQKTKEKVNIAATPLFTTFLAKKLVRGPSRGPPNDTRNRRK